MKKILQDRSAIVTGAGGGLGTAICRSLAADGARVLAVGRDSEKLGAVVQQVAELGGLAIPFTADITGPEAPRRVIESALEHFGALDILVNGAGTFVWKPFLEQTHEDWDRTIATNLSASFFLTQEAARVMIETEREGAILNIASIHGRVGDGNVVPHCASKFGVIGLTESTAEALREHGIRVNAIAPGQIAADSATRRGASPREPVTQADVATLAVYLVSDLARTVTGTVVDAFGSTRRAIKA